MLFTPLPNGWAVTAVRTKASRVQLLISLKSLYVPTARHPQGVLVRK